MMTFTERLVRRRDAWFFPSRGWWVPQRAAAIVHRRNERWHFRRYTDPDSAWRCCDCWQRTLVSKWNSREFALKHGCRVPKLYWFGRDIDQMPVESFPEQFVIRPILGHTRQGVYVVDGNWEWMRNRNFSRRELHADLLHKLGRQAKYPLLVEEFVRSEAGEYGLPVEYKFHMFGSRIGAVELIERIDVGKEGVVTAHVDEDWQPLPEPLHTLYRMGRPVPLPECHAEMFAYACRLGEAFGTYVRVDLYATDQGCVFGEFSTRPYSSELLGTGFGDQLLGKAWQEQLGERV